MTLSARTKARIIFQVIGRKLFGVMLLGLFVTILSFYTFQLIYLFSESATVVLFIGWLTCGIIGSLLSEKPK